MKQRNDAGVALVATILILALLGGLLVGFVALIAGDQRTGRAARDQSQAYAAAHAGLEKLTSDLGQLFASDYSPTCTDVSGLADSAHAPVLPGIQYVAPGGGSGYSIAFTCAAGHPQSEATPRVITAGPFQGFQGLVTPYDVMVTARTVSGAEVRMRRQMQTVAIPVFQFGMFAENDLSFFAGPNFNFGGRVHTNSNLFLAEGNGSTLTLADRVTVLGEVVRRNLSNGWLTAGNNYDGTVRVAITATHTTPMGFDQGSWAAAAPQLPGAPDPVTPGALEPQNNPAWTTFSVSTTNGYIRNGRTQARRLDLPLVQMGARPIDIIRRPAVDSNENATTPAVFGQRYFAMASVRILISDTAQDLTGLPTVTADSPVDLANLAASGYVVDGSHPPIARAPANANAAAQQNYLVATDTPLVGATGGAGPFIKIEKQLPDQTWQDVTLEILNRGFAGRNISNGTLNTVGAACAEPNPTAVIRLQRVRDNPSVGGTCGAGSTNAADYWPNVLYDAREGAFRDTAAQQTERGFFLGGVMHYVELDVRNLCLWLAAQGSNIMQETGYVVYFSDRRGNWHDTANGNHETAEYGFEDFVNASLSAGYPGDGNYSTPPSLNSGSAPEAGEDLNGDGELQTYGAIPFPLPALTGVTTPNRISSPFNGTTRPWSLVNWNYFCSSATTCTPPAFDLSRPLMSRVNPPVFFRRALKLVNGGKGNILAPGLTVASENPVYVQGNYNADSAGFGGTGDGHRACAILADAVTLLSNEWNDIRSFLSPHDPPGGHPGAGNPTSPGRVAAGDAWYRMAIVAGKGLSFPRPTGTYQDFGTDGGAHNFLRYIEKWDSTLNYRGSIVSFFTSRQAVGTYKCCQNVYSPPTRGYNFDVEFLTPSLLPPRTPMFRDINILTFRQILRATQ